MEYKKCHGNTKEELLIAAAVNGDREGINELHRRYEADLRRHIGARVRDHHVRQDQYQQTWAEICKRLSRFDPTRGSFGQFLGFWAGIVLLWFWREQAAYRR